MSSDTLMKVLISSRSGEKDCTSVKAEVGL